MFKQNFSISYISARENYSGTLIAYNLFKQIILNSYLCYRGDGDERGILSL